MDLKTITKQLIFILLIVFLGQSCAANQGCTKQKRCKTNCTEKNGCKAKKCKTKKCKTKKCKSKKCKSQKIKANNDYGTTIHANPDLSVTAAHSLEIAELRSQIQYLEELFLILNLLIPQRMKVVDKNIDISCL